MNTIIANYTGPTYWYRKYSDGWIEQGGKVTCALGAGDTVTLSYPVSFVNTPVSLIATVIAPRSSDSSGSELGLKTLASSYAELINDGSATNKQGYYWEAKGY